MVTDPDLLKNILVKDFDHFVNRRPFLSEKGSIVNDMLGNQAGDDWKSLRSVMSPTFTSGKMRGMFPIICDKADALVSVSLKEAVKKPNVDMKHNFGRFTMDVIAACAFGIECNSLVNEDAEFARVADQFFSFSFIRVLKFTLLNLSPKFYSALGLKIDPPAVKFFTGVAEETIKGRKAGQRRGDFLDLLLDVRAGQDHSTPTAHKSSTDLNQSTTRSQNLTAASNRTTIHESAPINDHSSTTYYLNATDNDSSVTNGSTTAKNHSTAASSKKGRCNCIIDSYCTNSHRYLIMTKNLFLGTSKNVSVKETAEGLLTHKKRYLFISTQTHSHINLIYTLNDSTSTLLSGILFYKPQTLFLKQCFPRLFLFLF